MILMLICIGCVKVYLKTKKMTNISQAQAGFKANSRRNPLWRFVRRRWWSCWCTSPWEVEGISTVQSCLW